ncbi:MAG: isoamylase early set domain-containing protein [Candidatus Omnitrophota bacterium]
MAKTGKKRGFLAKEILKEKRIKFVLDAPEANEVWLAGDFNNWDYRAMALKKDRRTSRWGANIALKPGRYEYKFVVDGNWINDPNNANKVVSALGTENSVIEF